MNTTNRKEFKQSMMMLKDVIFRYKKMSSFCKFARKSLKIARKKNDVSLAFNDLKRMAKHIKEVEEDVVENFDEYTRKFQDEDGKRLKVFQGIKSVPLKFSLLIETARGRRQRNKAYKKIKEYEGLRNVLKSSNDEELREVDQLIFGEEVRASSWSTYYY